MKVEKAKTAVIIIFAVINLLWLFLQQDREKGYILTAEQENAINGALSLNGISLETPLIKDYSPMKELVLKPFNYAALEAILFDGAEPSRISEFENFEGTTKLYNKSQITIHSDRLVFEKEDGLLPGISVKEDDPVPYYTGITAEEAASLCDNIINAVKNLGLDLDFVLNYHSGTMNHFIFEYWGLHNGMLIPSNSIIFAVDDYGIANISFYMQIPFEYSASSRDIYSADEALLTLIRHIKNDYPDNTDAVITDMELVYYLNEKTSYEAVAAPHYLFKVKANRNSAYEDRYYINAYTGQLTK